MTHVLLRSACTALALACATSVCRTTPGDPLPSWTEGPTKQAIVDFVGAVTEPGSESFVQEPDRIAVFDNDGTLWSEQPLYFQLFFVLDRVKELAPQHPEWQSQPLFQAALAGDMKTVLAGGEHGLLELVMATHTGNTPEEFNAVVGAWIAEARHPKTGRRYTEMAYQPMLELLLYLRASGFKTFIVSGGGIEFVRAWSWSVYGIPPEQVVGSSAKMKLEMRADEPVLVRVPEMDFVDDKAGKPVGIQRHIGRRPIAAFGNSDGDYEMLAWTTAGSGKRLGMIVHHDDDERESAYDRDSSVGKLARALDEAPQRGWIVASMKRDWAAVYAPVSP